MIIIDSIDSKIMYSDNLQKVDICVVDHQGTDIILTDILISQSLIPSKRHHKSFDIMITSYIFDYQQYTKTYYIKCLLIR
jgi:hypothetical protein